MEFSYRISEAQYAQAWNLGLGRRSPQAGLKAALFWAFIAICLLMLWAVVSKSASPGKEVEYSYSVLYDKIENGEVLDAIIRGDELRGHLKASPKEEFRTTLPPDHEDLVKAMMAARVTVTIKPKPDNSTLSLLLNVGPIVAIVVLWLVMARSGSMSLLPNYRKDPQMQGEFTVNIAPAGISIRNTAGTSSQSGWNIYESWRDAKDLIVLKYFSGAQFILNIAGLSDMQRQELRSTLGNALPKR